MSLYSAPIENSRQFELVKIRVAADQCDTTIYDLYRYMYNDEETVVIPKYINDIARYAFEGASNVKHIIIEEGVSTIKHSAFRNCTNLETIDIPQSITSIGDNAFVGCTSLKTVNIADGSHLYYIGEAVFKGCISLKDMPLQKCKELRTIGSEAFIDTAIESITFPGSLIDIPSHVIKSPYLKSVIIEEGVLRLGGCSFQDNKALEHVKLPYSLRYVGGADFMNCSKLKSKEGKYKSMRLTTAGNMKSWNDVTYNLGVVATARRKDPLMVGKNGIHFCTNLFDIIDEASGYIMEHKGPCGIHRMNFIVCEVEPLGDELATRTVDSACCARAIIPKRVLSAREIIDILNNEEKA